MGAIEIFSASAGVGQVLTDCFEPSAHRAAHEVGACNRMTVSFQTRGTLPEWIEWKLETSGDGGATWQGGPATVLWSGTSTRSLTVPMRPGTSARAVEVPRNGCVRILARRRGGGPDTTALGTGTFEDVAPKRRRVEEALLPSRPVRRVDAWGRAFGGPSVPGGRRPL